MLTFSNSISLIDSGRLIGGYENQDNTIELFIEKNSLIIKRTIKNTEKKPSKKSVVSYADEYLESNVAKFERFLDSVYIYEK